MCLEPVTCNENHENISHSLIPSGRRYRELRPVVDVVAVGGSLEQSVHPVLETVQQLVLEYRQMVWGVQGGLGWTTNSLKYDILW